MCSVTWPGTLAMGGRGEEGGGLDALPFNFEVRFDQTEEPRP